MISPMMKVVIIGADTTPEVMIQDIAQTGTVHIIENSKVEVDTESLDKSLQRLSGISKKLNSVAQKKSLPSSDLDIVVSEIEMALSKKESLVKKLSEYKNKQMLVDLFGQPSKDIEDELRHIGLDFFYILAPKSDKEFLNRENFIKAGTTDKEVFGILLRSFSDTNLPQDYIINLPEETASEIAAEIVDIELKLISLSDQINSYHCYKSAIDKRIVVLESQLQVFKAAGNISSKGILQFINGWVPKDRIEFLKETLTSQRYGIFVCDPEEGEEPPVMLRNSKWLNSCKPLYSLINSYPGYKEQDVSFAFLIFTCLFFAILVGDAGYGLLALIGTAAFSIRKHDSKFDNVLRLGWFFSVGAIVWGSLTGNWFGVKSIAELPVLNNFVIPWLDAFESNSQNNVILLCFIIGAIHISIAHIMKFTYGKHNMGELAWIGVIWSVFLVVRNLVLETPVPAFMNYLLSCSLIVIIAFSKPHKNVFKRLFGGLSSIPMKLMNCFADTISYIRLFAVGMATLAVAASFNEIALGVGFDTPLNFFLATLILLLGHGVNIAMAALAVVVHGLRLNMLEFSSHLGLEWSGQLFQPLKFMGD